MIHYIGNAQIAPGAFKTIRELVKAAIEARDYDTAAGKALGKSRFDPCIVCEGFIKPLGADLYMIDSFKGVVNGVATQADWAAGDFTAANGGAAILPTDEPRHFNNGTDLGARVLYNGNVGTVTVEFDLMVL